MNGVIITGKNFYCKENKTNDVKLRMIALSLHDFVSRSKRTENRCTAFGDDSNRIRSNLRC